MSKEVWAVLVFAIDLLGAEKLRVKLGKFRCLSLFRQYKILPNKRSFKLCVLKYFMVVYLPSYLDPERTFSVYNDSH